MKGIILLNGEPPAENVPVEEDDIVLCCDGAFRWAEKKVARIDRVLGDFDSLGFIPQGGEVYPAEKNATDGEIALEELLEEGVREIEIYGGGGGREDHLFGNLQLLYAAYLRGARATMFTEHGRITCAGGAVELCGKKGRTFSLAPAGKSAHIMDCSGVKYPLDDLTLRAGSCRGLSNVATEPVVRFTCDRGALFVFEIASGKE